MVLMLDDQFIADTVRRTNTIAFKNLARWNSLFSGFLDRYMAASAELRDWEARVEAHKKRVREEPQLRWGQRPPEANDEWVPIHYCDPSVRIMTCPWPRPPKPYVVDGKVLGSMYPRQIEPAEIDIIWDAYGWTPPELLPEAKPVIPIMLLDHDAQYQELDLDGMVFALTCFHDTYGPRFSANIRPINPWGFGTGSDRGFTDNKENDNRSMVFLIMMRRAERLEDWQVERVKAALAQVQSEFQGQDSTDTPKEQVEPNPRSVMGEKIDPATHAVALLIDDPTISPTELAKRVGVSRGTLYGKSKKWNSVRLTLTARDSARVPRGEKSADGTLEAADEFREFHPIDGD